MKNFPLGVIVSLSVFLGFFFSQLLSKREKQIAEKKKTEIMVDTTFSKFFPTKKGNIFNMIVLTVPDNQQPYKTPGSYFWNEKGQLVIKVSEMNNWKYSYLVAIHEIVESQLCIEHGIPLTAIDSFDRQWHYIPGSSIEEPGADPRAPYHKEHMKSLEIEENMCKALGEQWIPYNKKMEEWQQ